MWRQSGYCAANRTRPEPSSRMKLLLRSVGTNNVMLMTSGLNYGVRRTVPHLLGVVLEWASEGSVGDVDVGAALALVGAGPVGLAAVVLSVAGDRSVIEGPAEAIGRARTAANAVSLTASVQENLNRMADAFQRDVDESLVDALHDGTFIKDKAPARRGFVAGPPRRDRGCGWPRGLRPPAPR